MRVEVGVVGLVVLVLVLSTEVVRGQNLLANANPGYVTSTSNYVCTTRGDCCAKAIACLRHIAHVGVYDGVVSSVDSACIYPKCRDGYKFNKYDNSGAETCDRFVPFRGVAKHRPFESWDHCMGDCDDTSGTPNDVGFCSPPDAVDLDGTDMYTNRQCMAAFLTAHDRCVEETVSLCLAGTVADGFCDESERFEYDDWNTELEIAAAYPSV